MPEPSSTRDRLLDEGMRLFAEVGYRATTIRMLESAVGLQPGRGGFYRHFPSKDALFAACLEEYRQDIETFVAQAEGHEPVGELAVELELLVRGALAVLGRQQPLLRLMAREGDTVPGVTAVHEVLVDAGYRHTGRIFRRLTEAAGLPVTPARVRAVAALALGSIVHFVEDGAVHGVAPAGASEGAFVRAWVDVWLAFLSPPEVRSEIDRVDAGGWLPAPPRCRLEPSLSPRGTPAIPSLRTAMTCYEKTRHRYCGAAGRLDAARRPQVAVRIRSGGGGFGRERGRRTNCLAGSGEGG